jgi:uncharacterized protein YggT (Ycf19 family)
MTVLIVKLAFEALVTVIIVGIVLTMICQVSRAKWTRHLALRAVMAAAYFLCTPIRQLMKSVGIPVAPVDFSPLLTVLALRLIQSFLVGFLRFLP